MLKSPLKWVCALTLGGLLFAESPQPPSGLNSPGPNTLNPSAIKVLDGDFFDKKKEEKPQTSGGNRYMGDDPDYTSDERDKWLKKCDPLKEKKGGEEFRKCYQEEKSRFQKGLREAAEAVERRQNEPLRNTNPLLEEKLKNLTAEDDD